VIGEERQYDLAYVRLGSIGPKVRSACVITNQIVRLHGTLLEITSTPKMREVAGSKMV
jgi:hypothetical protein